MQGRNRDEEVEKGHADTGEKEDGRMNGEHSTGVYTLPCVKQIASGKLLHSTGSSAWHSVMM